MKRGRIEVLADIVHACPDTVHDLVSVANTHYSKLLDAHGLGLIEMQFKGMRVKRQTVVATDKGLELYGLIKRARKPCRK